MSKAKNFLIGLVAGLIGLIGMLALLFVALDATGRLKAPAFANRLSFDEKMLMLRQEPLDDVEVLLVGSSTTLHGVDGDVLRQELGMDGQVLNLGVQDLRVNQIKFMAETFLDYFPDVGQVIMVSTLLDYKDCGDGTETAFFKPDDVLGYISGRWPKLYYYFRYLDLLGTYKRAGEIDYLRSTIEDLESVSFDDYGSLLLRVPRERIIDRVWVGDPITLDPPCYDALAALAEELRARDVDFTFVIAPMRPGYLEGRDPDGSLIAEHRARVADILGQDEAVVVDAHAALDLPEEAFFDAYHLNRDRVPKLTRYMVEQMVTQEPGQPRTSAIGALSDHDSAPAGTL